VDAGSELLGRKSYLGVWAHRCEEFIKEKKRLPESLYEIAWYEEQGPPRCKINIGIGAELPADKKAELKDKDLFKKNVEYIFLANEKNWIIMELKPGKHWKHRLMIDDSKHFFEVRNLPSEF
jgi:hypothetical protein